MTAPLTRRSFFRSAGLLALAWPLRSWAATVDTSGGDEIVILNDIHITGAPEAKIPANAKGDSAHLRQAIGEILARPKKPAAIIINGDLALSVGTAEDYALIRELIAPLREAGIPVHLTLGNHDVRPIFAAAFPEMKSASALKEPRHNGLIDLPTTRLILLDTLDQTPGPSGRLGAEQIAWILEKADETPDKQVILVGHHNPTLGGDSAHFKGGLVDAPELWSELSKRTQVKAYLHGHTHEWTIAKEGDLHIVSTLACAYVFREENNALGWTSARLNAKGFELQLHTLDAKHVWNGETKWFFGRLPPRARLRKK